MDNAEQQLCEEAENCAKRQFLMQSTRTDAVDAVFAQVELDQRAVRD